MGALRSTIGTILLLTVVALAGCSDNGDEGTPDDLGSLDVTSDTGGIRGVVVDTAVQPIPGVTVSIPDQDMETITDETGAFRFSGLEAGEYLVRASHPLYSSAQQLVPVEAGVAQPPVVKFQLERVITEDPYMITDKYAGFISCSANLVVILSEECGEGVGVPGMGRVGGQENNHAQIDFTVDGPFIKSLIIEQVWEPSTSIGVPGAQSGNFYTVLATDWSCDPICGGNRLGEADSGSPLMIRVDSDILDAANLTASTTISTFTWASAEETGVLIDQEFELFVSAFYYLPAPEGWSFVAGSPNPYK